MSEVGGPLAEMSQYSCLDRLHSFGLLGVVGDPVFRAVGVRHKQRPLAVVAAAGAQRHLFFGGGGPRLARVSSAPLQASLRVRRFAQLRRVFPGRTFTRCSRVVAQSWGSFSLTEQRPQLVCCLPCAPPQASSRFFARLMDAKRLYERVFLWVCALLAALQETRVALPLHISRLPSPRETPRNDSLGILRTRFIVTGRLSPFRAETRATAGRPAPRQAFIF